MMTDMLNQTPKVDLRILVPHLSLSPRQNTRRTVMQIAVQVKTLVISTTFQREVKSCVRRIEDKVNHFPIN
jgi:hypothetical protein